MVPVKANFTPVTCCVGTVHHAFMHVLRSEVTIAHVFPFWWDGAHHISVLATQRRLCNID